MLRLTKPIAALRSEFRGEGFRVPDVFAAIVSEMCGGAHTPESTQAEWDEGAREYLRDGFRKPPPVSAVDLEYRRVLGGGFMPEAFHRRIDDQKRVEAEAMLKSWPGQIERRTHLRDFAEAFAGSRGFSKLRSKSNGRALRKNPSHEGGCVGEITIDVGGRSGQIWSSNQTNFHIGRDEVVFAWPFLPGIVRGALYYTSANPSYEVLSANRHVDPRPPTLVSDLIKLGVMAEIVLFDLLLGCLDASPGDM